MKRPEVTLENYEAVYRFYGEHEQNQRFAQAAHFLLGKLYHPEITTDEGVAEAITEELQAGSRLVVSPNHLTDVDQYNMASLYQRFEPLRPLRGNCFAPSKAPLFNESSLKGKLQRRVIDELGAVPTFRREDLHYAGREITPEVDEMYHRAIIVASDMQVAKLASGHHMAGFWEGTRNRNDPMEVQELKRGIGFTAIAAAEEERVLLLPVGIFYGRQQPDFVTRYPYIHIGTPIPVETTDAGELAEQLRPAMQRCVNAASTTWKRAS